MNNSAEQKKRETIVDTRNPEVWHRTAKERVWQKKKHSLHFVGRLGAERTLFFFEVFFFKIMRNRGCQMVYIQIQKYRFG
jgi:hypothetical protein